MPKWTGWMSRLAMRKRRSAQQRQANRWLKMFHIDLKTLFATNFWRRQSLQNKRWLAILNILQLFAQEGDWVGADKYSESFLRRFFVSRILTQDMEIILKDKAFYTWDNKVGVMLIRKYYHRIKHSYMYIRKIITTINFSMKWTVQNYFE